MYLKLVLSLLFTIILISEPAFAAGGLGNLNKSTDALEEIKTWLFGIAGVSALIYMVYLVVMAFAEKKSWNDVMMALVYCAVAGGCLMAGNWALSMWD
ncbi:trbC/VIRB2 family protein (plasmid) [Yersinia frederiksenii Y225]|nr:trbC/VIRB2 family protein [Yersinia frederiksenii Y225]